MPYAEHAKTANSITNMVPETDPVFFGSVASGINATDTIRWNNKSGSEKQDLYEVLNQGNDARGLTVSNVATPSDYQDAVTKAYVDETMASAERVEKLLNDAGLFIIKDPDSTDHSEKPFVLTRDVTDIFFRTASGGGIIGNLMVRPSRPGEYAGAIVRPRIPAILKHTMATEARTLPVK